MMKKVKTDSARDPKDWQKQYEEQKAKALERLTASKNGTATDTNVSGLSGLIPSKTKMNTSWNKSVDKIQVKTSFYATLQWRLYYYIPLGKRHF